MNEIKEIQKAVDLIKQAILQSQYHAAKGVNCVQLSLYYGIGQFVSENTRKGYWGTGAINGISDSLQKQLPGLRGFSPANIKFMRQFYEAWHGIINSLTAISEIEKPNSLTTINE